ncbi:alpha-protein kinase 1-like [Anopheles ziemanni]|uniref:alpha-protein kinase 1-like n=1 Tax=Anopheles coustani TaxID=139045 RepID=UPI00265AEE08|nr:alpha-protein kinase 1-like [Anopheles coustani]XP_058177528.1 alpha-protein kinase 1-like [Anopheles ziemanni]
MGLGSSVVAAPKCENIPSFATKPVRHSKQATVTSNAGMTNGTMFQPQYTEVFSAAPSSAVPGGSVQMEQFNTANSQHWQSMEASAPTISTTRQSRSRHRNLFDSRLNTSFVDSEVVNSAADTRLADIRRVEENLRMESRMLSENNNIPMARCSTPSPAYCFHCDHDHRERCCLYVGDKPEDGPYYSRWKRDLENPSVRPQYIPKIPEAVSGNSTPFWFPAYTYTKPEEIRQKMMEKHPPLPPVWMRQYYYPLVGHGHEYQLLNQATLEPPTPYQQYLQQHQQELYRLYHQQQQQQMQQQQQFHHQHHHSQHQREDPLCRDGRKCTAISPETTPYVQQFQHVHSVQPMQPTPYFYQSSYYNGHLPPPQQQFYAAGYSTTTGGIPIYHDAYLHPAHYPVSYAPATPLPAREPTPPAAPTTSTPLWLLFCQKLSRKFPDRSKKSSPSKGRSAGKGFPHHHVRHNPTTIVQPPALSNATPDYHHPPKYTTFEHPHQLQFQAPQSYYKQPMNPVHHSSRMGQTMVTHHLASSYYTGQLPAANDIGMYYVPPTAVDI